MSGFSTLYWINPYGKILKQSNTTHIQAVTKNPAVFGVDRKWIEKIYDKYDEPVGTEGGAREEILNHLFKQGYVRVRLYVNKYWSITLSNFRNRRIKKALSKWAEDAVKDKSGGMFMPVRIVDIQTNKLYTNWTAQDIMFEKHLFESDTPDIGLLFKPEFVKTIEELALPKIKFKDIL